MFGEIIKLTLGFFAVMNPIGNIPIFISLTGGYSLKDKRKTARKAVIVSFIILTVFLLIGKLLFEVFGITIHAFRVAGGILIFGIAYSLLHAKNARSQSPHPNERKEVEARDDISVTPLALPILAGNKDDRNRHGANVFPFPAKFGKCFSRLYDCACFNLCIVLLFIFDYFQTRAKRP